MGTPPPGGYSPHGTRHPLPANPLSTTRPGTPNFSVPDLAPADNKIHNDGQKNTLLQRKSKYYLFIYSNRTWEFSLQERSWQNVIIISACVFLSFLRRCTLIELYPFNNRNEKVLLNFVSERIKLVYRITLLGTVSAKISLVPKHQLIVPSTLLAPATDIRTHKATKIHTLSPLTCELFSSK